MPPFDYCDVYDIIDEAKTRNEAPFIIILDEIAPNDFEITIENVVTDGFTVQVNAKDEQSGIDKNRYFVNGNLVGETSDNTYTVTKLAQQEEYVVKVTAVDRAGNEKTKELQWVFSQHKDLEKSGRDGTGPSLKDKLLTAVNSDNEPYENDVQLGTKAVAGFKWPAKTHHVSVLKDGLISVFDNSGELYDKTMATTKNSNAAVYKIDSAHKTVSLKWFEALPFAAESASSVFYEPNKNTVTVYLSTVTDKNQTGISFGKLITYDLTTHAVLFEATVYRGGETYFYRAEPFSFPNQQGGN